MSGILILPSKTNTLEAEKPLEGSAKEHYVNSYTSKHLWEETWENLHKHRRRKLHIERPFIWRESDNLFHSFLSTGHKTIPHLTGWLHYSMKRLLSFPPAPWRQLFTFFMSPVFGLWSFGCGHKKEVDSHRGVSFGSNAQHVVANGFFSLVNRDTETANCYSSSAYWLCLCQRSRKSFGQMGLLLTSPLQWWTTLFDLHIIKSSVYFMAEWKENVYDFYLNTACMFYVFVLQYYVLSCLYFFPYVIVWLDLRLAITFNQLLKVTWIWVWDSPDTLEPSGRNKMFACNQLPDTVEVCFRAFYQKAFCHS